MKIEDFLKKLKQCKKSYSYGYDNFKVFKDSEKNIFQIYLEPKKKICPCCKTDLTKEGKKIITIKFNYKQEHLTVFQSNLFYFLYILNEIPADYAQYHKCIAGKKFIENIKEVII